jgi:hypothetical protein
MAIESLFAESLKWFLDQSFAMMLVHAITPDEEHYQVVFVEEWRME